MKLDRLRIQNKPKLMIIPMIDIIFFLLVFFMISTLNMVEQRTLPIRLPQTQSAQVSTDQAVTIAMTQTGQIYWNDVLLERTQLASHVAQQLSTQPDAVFILRGDKDLPYGELLKLFDELKLQGVHKLSLATERR